MPELGDRELDLGVPPEPPKPPQTVYRTLVGGGSTDADGFLVSPPSVIDCGEVSGGANTAFFQPKRDRDYRIRFENEYYSYPMIVKKNPNSEIFNKLQCPICDILNKRKREYEEGFE
jgi:hypothetical protein